MKPKLKSTIEKQKTLRFANETASVGSTTVAKEAEIAASKLMKLMKRMEAGLAKSP